MSKPLSVRQRVKRKILVLAFLMGLVGAVLVGCVFFALAYPGLQSSRKINQRTLSEVTCTESNCDTSVFTTDWELAGPDYLIHKPTGYFLEAPSSEEENLERFGPLDFSDISFIKTFREPSSYETPDGEVWRLYSRSATSGGRDVEIIIGYAEKAPWKMVTTSRAEIHSVDVELQRQADLIAKIPPATTRGTRSNQRLSADGFAIVDAKTGHVAIWGPWVPMFLPKDKHLPYPGYRCYIVNGELYIARTDSDEKLTAVSLVDIGDLWRLAMLVTLAFAITSAIAVGFSAAYLARIRPSEISCTQIPFLDEGETVEFKSSLRWDYGKQMTNKEVERAIVKTVVGFLNSESGGTLVIGISDSKEVLGLQADYATFTRVKRDRDGFEQMLSQAMIGAIGERRCARGVKTHFCSLQGKELCVVTVVPSSEPVFLEDEGGSQLYVRVGNTTRPFGVREAIGYARDRWGGLWLPRSRSRGPF